MTAMTSTCIFRKTDAIARRAAGFSVVLALLWLHGSCTADSPPAGNFEWLRHARVFILDAYTYPLAPGIEFDAEKYAQTMADMHVDTVRVPTSGNHWLIPGTPFGTASDLGDRDILAECIAACKPHGIRVVPYVRTGGCAAAEVVKPEWAHRADPSGNIRVWWGLGARRSAFCWNTQYRQAFYDLIDRLVTNYDIDGIYFDAWLSCYSFPSPRVCYCSGCTQGFQKATGLKLPYRENANAYTASERNVISRYHNWYGQELLTVFRETKRRIRSHKNIPLLFNLNHARFINDTTRTHPRIVEESNAFLYEMSKSMFERIEGTSLAVSHGMSVWPYSDTYHGYPRIPVYQYGQQQHLYATMAFGGSPTVYHTYVYVDHPKSRGPVREAFTIFDRNQKYVAGYRSQPFCAVVWNDEDPPGHADNSWLWQTNAKLCASGALTACLDQHIQVTSFLKQDLERPELLHRYKVLYLPDVCVLSDLQISGIKRFVAEGGGLVMTYATSLYDENGKRRPDFALGPMAGIQSVKPEKTTRDKMESTLVMGGVWDLYLKARPSQSVLSHALADNLMPMALYEPVQALPTATVVADIVMGSETEQLFPGLIVSTYGKGKVAYIPAALDAMYRQTRIRQFAELLRDVVTHVSPHGLPYRIDAPATLIANMTTGGNTRVLHLINWTGCKCETKQQNVYYIPDVENVVVHYNIPDGKTVTDVRLFVPAECSHRVEGNQLHVMLPRVKHYQGVVIEMR